MVRSNGGKETKERKKKKKKKILFAHSRKVALKEGGLAAVMPRVS
jgi:hypothetical protein